MSENPVKHRSGGRVVLVVLGAIVGVLALAALAGAGFGLWADRTQRDDDGYFTTASHHFAASGYAITHEGTKIGDVPGWLDVGDFARVKIDARSANGHRLFVGIAPQRALETYLGNVAHSKVRDLDVDPFEATYDRVPGTAEPARPGSERIWVAKATGTHPRLTWRLSEGRWGVVVMNADGGAGVAADVAVGAKVGYLAWIWGGLFGLGAALLAIGALLIALGLRRGGGNAGDVARAGGSDPAVTGGATYPAVLTARLEEPLSRWLWLVKWLLLIPHVIVLAFLWAAFVVLTVVAWVAILATGRYPRTIFDFNVGVMRWTWRVHYYGYGALGTDRYPPFSLELRADYPAALDIAYPPRLSRGLALVKWLLAVPHLVIVGIFAGSTWWVDQGEAWRASWPGLVGVLALIAGVALLFTARYPRGLFDLLIGLNRWILRTFAYVALMTDEYPPFRLDSGGAETQSTPPPMPAAA